MRYKGIDYSRYDKTRMRRRGGETKKQRHIKYATQMQSDLEIITNNNELAQHYSSLVGGLMPTEGKNAKFAVKHAIELTKQFAKQNDIPWGLP